MAGLLKRQVEFEASVGKQLNTFFQSMAETLAVQQSQQIEGNQLLQPDQMFRMSEDYQDERRQVEERITGYQLPISFRYRNDGATGTHRLEYILKGTPYKTGTTEWDDDEWTAIPGADAEIYTA